MSTSSSLRTWLPVIFWTGIIVLESGFGSSANTGSVLYAIAHRVFAHIDPVRLELVNHVLRKTGHFIGYGILGYLWFRALSRTMTRSARMACAALAIACTFIVASLDEFHQSFSPGRTAAFSDVMLDTCGAVVLVAIAMIARRATTTRGAITS